MAREALTKDELRQDPFKDWFFHAVDYVHKRRKRFIAGGTAALVIVVAGVALWVGQRLSAQRMAERFNEAERIALNTIANPKDAAKQARDAFQAFVDDYPDAALSPYAWMRLASLAGADGDAAAAEKALRRILDSGRAPGSLRAVAATALAKLYEDRGERTKSEELYRGLEQEPFGDLAEYSLGRLALADRKAEEARQHFQAVEQQHPESALAQLARQVLLFVR
jgi:predicted negative regulator of RcsB-dependent stress response